MPSGVPAMNFGGGGGGGFNYNSLFNLRGPEPEPTFSPMIRNREADFSNIWGQESKSPFRNLFKSSQDDYEPRGSSGDFSFDKGDRRASTPQPSPFDFSSTFNQDEEPYQRRATPAQEAYQSFAKTRPTREQNKPGFWTKLGALAAAGGVGYLTKDYSAGAALGTGIADMKYNRAMQEYEGKEKTLGTAAQEERLSLAREREDEEAMVQKGYTREQAERLRLQNRYAPAEQEREAAKAKAAIDRDVTTGQLNQARAEQIAYNMDNPEMHIDKNNKGELTFINKRDPSKSVTIPGYQLSEERLIQLRAAQSYGVAQMQINAAAQRQGAEHTHEIGLEGMRQAASAGGTQRISEGEVASALENAWALAGKSRDPEAQRIFHAFKPDPNNPRGVSINQDFVDNDPILSKSPWEVSRLERELEEFARVNPGARTWKK